MMKKYNKSPLPFMGQKRNFIKKFTEVLKQCPSNAIYVDLFGGSGLLAHNVKYMYQGAQVVYNDFDNYTERLQNVNRTNVLLSKIRILLEGVPRNKKVPNDVKIEILELIKLEEKIEGFVDYVTLSASILFSMNYANNYEELSTQTMYNVVKRRDYTSEGYLVGVDFVCADYLELFDKYKDDDNVIFLVDPPYLSTEVKTYKDVNRWGISDYLDILNVLEGTKYIYFTSDKSQIVELCEWFETSTLQGNPFKYAQTATVKQHITYNSTYTDKMIYKVD